MARIQRRTVFITAAIVLVVILLIALAVVLTKKHATPATTTATNASQQPTSSKDTTTETDSTETTSPTNQTTAPVADPSTLSSVDIDGLGIKVFYTKGTPGFEYAIKKTTDGTQYVEFTSTDLIGTKCTNDEGVFAMITKNPSASEDQGTVSQTTKVGNDSYGLSLASASCTSNDELLNQYQTGFKNGFSSLSSL